MTIETSSVERIEELRIEAAKIWEENGSVCPEPEEISITRDTIEDFRKKHGGYTKNKMIEQDNAEWENVQINGKGSKRVSIYVIDLGDFRASFVC